MKIASHGGWLDPQQPIAMRHDHGFDSATALALLTSRSQTECVEGRKSFRSSDPLDPEITL